MSAQLSTVPPVAKIPRVRAVHDLSVLFPECPSISRHRHVKQSGFADAAAGGVPERIPYFVQEESFLEEFVSFVSNQKRFVVTLTGPTGCGKSERVLDFYSRLNYPVHSMPASRDTRAYHIIGDMWTDENGKMQYMKKKLYKAMANGHPFLLDEGYRLPATVTSKFHSIRDRGELDIEETGETLKAKPGFKFIITANQRGYGDESGQYFGDEDQDQAWLNGSPTIECDYPAPAVEEGIVRRVLEEAHPAFASESSLADYPKNMVAVANACRAAMKGDAGASAGRFELAFSTRTLVMWAEYFVDFHLSNFGRPGCVHPLYRSLDFVIARRGCLATRNAIDSFMLTQFKFDRKIPA